jgi:lysophospholipase L1-like esterase
MSRTRWFDIAAIALTLAVIAGLGFVLRPQETPTIMVAPSTARVDRPQPTAATRPSVLFIGDSYTAGSGLAEMSYGCMAAVRMGWLCDLSAVPGTGYISGGPANRFIVDRYLGPSTSFAERIPGLAEKYQPDVVILDGGRNDLFPPRDDVFKAMSATIGEVRRAWPKATIVFIRPRLLARPDDDLGFDGDFIARLLAEPAARGMVVLDPIGSFRGTDTSALLSTDQTHPNPQGEWDLASALVDSLVTHRLATAP